MIVAIGIKLKHVEFTYKWKSERYFPSSVTPRSIKELPVMEEINFILIVHKKRGDSCSMYI